ncbi:hypothetical protein JCM10908_000803, partial [Rhodotorula pacifica]|uniref:uncharacterized protein n=1 Tax=Rhodotorula pacifica TaxID=1495444 RepID=UPI0031746EA0
ARRVIKSVNLPNVGGVHAHELLWIDAAAINRDAQVFHEPERIRLDRKPDDYNMNERISNLASRSGQSLNTVVACAVMTQLCAMGSPERARGPAGELGCVVGADGMCQSYLSRDGPPTAFPSSMTVKIKTA